MVAASSIPYERSVVQTDDGVTLAVQSAGSGPAVLIGNGIGVTSPGLDPLVDHLWPHHRVVTWDYRGVGESRLPRPDLDLSVQRHAADALTVLDALGEPRAAVLGWSLGVPVGLEVARAAPRRVVAFGALFGAAGRPFRAAFPAPYSDLVHGLVSIACEFPQGAQALLDLGSAAPGLAFRICSALGFCGPGSDRETFAAHVRSTAGADKWAYFRTMREMMEHDAHDVLPELRCPVLIVAGDGDWVTPPDASREMARLARRARLVILPGTSHFGVIEHGPVLWDLIDELLADARWVTPGRSRAKRRARTREPAR